MRRTTRAGAAGKRRDLIEISKKAMDVLWHDVTTLSWRDGNTSLLENIIGYLTEAKEWLDVEARAKADEEMARA